jgi:ATP-dependent HslUV protease subunit HslV
MNLHGTTILAVKLNGHIAMAADGQVTSGGSVVLKSTAKKIRKFNDGNILVGFAGSVADAFTLLDLFEAKLESTIDIEKISIALAKEWRTNKMYARLEAELIIADKDNIILLTGDGEVIKPEYDCMAIGSGGYYAYSAALAYLDANQQLDDPYSVAEIARLSLGIASKICIYTNSNITVEVI